MEKEKKFDKRKYDTEYIKTHKRQFKVSLNINEYEELCKLLADNNITKVQFVRNAFNELKKND